jgi:manganese transport protein
MEGFLNLKMKPVWRRLLTRSAAALPAVVVAASMGDAAVGQLLVVSQVILSMQLSFAVIPLVWFTAQRRYCGRFASSVPTSVLAGAVAVLIAGLNGYLLISVLRDPSALKHG